MQEQLLTIRQVAEIIGKSDKTIRRAIHTRKLTASRLGGSWRIKPQELNKWIDQTDNNPKRRLRWNT